jgi:hypothetical protein
MSRMGQHHHGYHNYFGMYYPTAASPTYGAVASTAAGLQTHGYHHHHHHHLNHLNQQQQFSSRSHDAAVTGLSPSSAAAAALVDGGGSQSWAGN